MGVPLLYPYNMPILSNKGIHDLFDGVMSGYSLTFRMDNVLDVCQMHLTHVHTYT
jgi:hypothetical protein